MVPGEAVVLERVDPALAPLGAYAGIPVSRGSRVVSVLSVCDEVVVLDFGQVIARGTPDRIRADEAVIAAYLGSRKEEAHA